MKRLLQSLREVLRTQSFRTLGIFAGGNIVVVILGGVGSLIQARWIEPEAFGEFRKFGILTTYLNIGLVIVHDGLSRQFPYLLGRNETERAVQVAAIAKWWYLFLCWVFSLVFLALSLASLFKGDVRAAVGWAVQIPIIWTAIYGVFLGVMYRTSSDFKQLSYNNVISTIVGFGALLAVKLWGYWGLAVRSAVQSIASVYLGRRHVPVKARAVFNLGGLVDLAKIAVPLSIPGYIGTSCVTASVSLIVVKYCGQTGLGVYSVALAIQTMALTFTMTIHQIFLTKLTYKFGETGDVAACLRYIRRPTLMSVGAAIVLAVGLCLVIDPVVRLFMPQYRDVIPVIRILAVKLPITAAALPLIILQSALWYKSVMALALIQLVVCLATIAILPKTLNWIAASTAVGDFLSLLTGFGILRWNNGKY